ncbi:MAG: zinc ABC transporter substrate-binding protein [Thermomicrobiales bacterium]|nr:zinc ABC transporter substrate-binding protein [Thermomicrobiales bacterium]
MNRLTLVGGVTRRGVLTGLAAAGALAAWPGHGVLAQDATPAAVVTLGWSDELVDDNGKLNVATTVAPISSIARNVGGDRIDLRGIVPDGTNSHTFEPAPSDARILAAADIVFVNGLDLELPTMELAEANLRDGAEIVTLGDKTVTEDEYVYDFSFPQEEGHPNPHLWTNPVYARRYAEIIADTLTARDPENADYYAENLARYSAALDALDAAISEAAATVPEENRKLLTYHDSWAYFAPRYGFTVIGAAQPSDFSEPSPQEVAALIDQIRAEGVPAVFGSEVFASSVLEQIAQEAGATYIDQLRDDEPPGELNAPEHTYLGMMIRNMDLMLPALGGDASAVTALSPADTYVQD